MTIEEIAKLSQLLGIIVIYALFGLIFWIAIDPKSSKRILRIAIIWTCIYVFFLGAIRLISYLHLATDNQLRILANVSSLIPFIAIIIHFFLDKKILENAVNVVETDVKKSELEDEEEK